ncbi:hypothetical protein MXC99_00730 [Thauera aromatica]|uniref:hypothetical protein n=1 Tax=Thauera aromatica TaxID=59405 RepID=UPI001FFDB846|nr:hypothetical protein [Thauera aromatica]MCK2086721.1 hypothetical protein [Thauera aromatica]
MGKKRKKKPRKILTVERDPNWGIGKMQVTRRPNGTLHVTYDGHASPPAATSARTYLVDPIRRNNANRFHDSRKAPPLPRGEERPTGTPIRIGKPVVRSFRLTLPDDFKEPDDWIAIGGQTMLSRDGKNYAVYMGIDFGTAYTKASIGFGGDIFIVDWTGVSARKEKFVLPGEFSVLSDGSCTLGRSPRAIRVASDLKLPFLEGHASKTALIDATVFLALVMRYIRAWWFYRHAGLSQNCSLEWNVNLGSPSTPWQDNAIRAKYERVAKAAWILSLGDASVNVDRTEQALEGLIHPSDGSLASVEIVPEFVAQIASYTRSPQRQPDLHMLIDIGAGTVDVVTFNVHREDQTGEDRFPIFWASVTNLGTHYLMSRRLHACSQESDGFWEDSFSVPTADEFSQASGVPLHEVRCVDHAHTVDVANAVTSVLRITRQRRYRRSPNWNVGIRVFLGGGGSSCETFEQVMPVAAKQSGVLLPRIRLPLPERLKAPDLPRDQFHRVSVAFGLGMDAFNLGQIVSMAEVQDDSLVDLPPRPSFNWDDG